MLVRSYRVYITDSLFWQAHNQMLTMRWEEVISHDPSKEKSAQEIVDETMLKAGLTLKE